MSSRPDLFALDGETAVVTGGLGRLGSQYAATLARAGASVAVIDVATTVNPLVQSLLDEKLPVSVHTVDLLDRPRVRGAAEPSPVAFPCAPTYLAQRNHSRCRNKSISYGPAMPLPATFAITSFPIYLYFLRAAAFPIYGASR
jgi:hypothetical protein